PAIGTRSGTEGLAVLREEGDGLMQRYEVASGRAALGLGEGAGGDLAQLGVLAAQAVDLGLERHHAADALEVHPLAGQLLDAAEALDVDIAVATVATLRASRLHQPAALVDAQRLRVHAGQFGGD